MAIGDAADFAYRLSSLLPQPWFSPEALSPGGSMYNLLLSMGSSYATHYNQTTSTTLQTRIKTATGNNLDNISLDYLGNTLPRLTGEPDAAYQSRVIAAIVQQRVTLVGIQEIVNSYYLNVFSTLFSSTPTAVVWDSQSDPSDASHFNISPPQFVIRTDYPMPKTDSWYIGYSYLGIGGSWPGFGTNLFNSDYQVFPSALDPVLAALIDSVRAVGTIPVYIARFVSY